MSLLVIAVERAGAHAQMHVRRGRERGWNVLKRLHGGTTWGALQKRLQSVLRGPQEIRQ